MKTKVSLIGRVLILGAALSLIASAPPANPFQRLDNCVYKPQRWDDGDSFHVILSDQKEVVVRLYFVDTPEEELVYTGRINEQAAYFGIAPEAVPKIGREASEITKLYARKPLYDLHTLAPCARSQLDLAILRNRGDR